MADHPTAAEAHARLNALLEAERRAARKPQEAAYRRRIIEAAAIDPADLTVQARRVLDWLAEWDEPTTVSLVEILSAVRTGARVDDHRAQGDRNVSAQRKSETATEAARARYDERWGVRR
jgi:hypothetical protein